MPRCLFILILLAPSVANAENWPHWRGPNFNGSTTETGLATQWSRTEGIEWSAALPGPSAATPIIYDRHVFVASAEPTSNRLLAGCYNASTGKLMWEHVVFNGDVFRDTRSTFASCSPVTNGDLVVFFYGNGEMAGYGLDGHPLWQRNIGKDYGQFAFMWTFASSPLFYGDRIYLQVLQRDVPVGGRGHADRPNESYLLTIDPANGETIWKVERDCQANAESRESYASPVVLKINGREQLIIAGGDDVSGHDPADGAELWRWGTWNPSRIDHWRFVPTPVAVQDTVLVCAPKKSPVFAVRPNGDGDLPDDAVLWTSEDDPTLTSDVPSPGVYDGDFFILSDVRKSLARVDPTTGQIKWSAETPGAAKYEASPLVADGKVYVLNFVGDVVIFDAASGAQINVISMAEPADDPIRSSIAAANGRLFIRTNDRLYCIAPAS